MKNAIIICLICLCFFSCKSNKTPFSSCVTIYKSEWLPGTYTHYIILKAKEQSFVRYVPDLYVATVGIWRIKGDTLFFQPEYEYYSLHSGLKFEEVTPENLTVSTIPQKFLIKEDHLLEITDISIIMSKYFDNYEQTGEPARYNRIE